METLTEPAPPQVLRRPRRRLGFVIALSVLCAALLAARLAAPHFVKEGIDRRLMEIPGYNGWVEGVSLNLWRGAYRINGMTIVKSNGRVNEPFFSADRIDFSVAWLDLLHGRLVSQIYIENARLNFLRGADEASSQLTADKRWQDLVNDLFPIDITYVDVKGGVLRFIDTTRAPKVDIGIRDLRIHAAGLRNRPSGSAEEFPATVYISGETIGKGQLRLFTKLEPLADKPHFQLAMELQKVSLPALNDFMKAYADVEVSQGQFEVFAQMSMKDGRYVGYVKPFLSHVSFADVKGEKKTLGHRIWKGLVAAAADLAENSQSKQSATRIPFSGEESELDIHTWKTIQNALHHGFVKAFPQGFEGTANPDDVSPPPPPEKPAQPAQTSQPKP